MSELLPVVWFGLLGLLLAGYAVLDGFDLGVGMMHLFVARDDLERRMVINSIGPLWDGNEVWLVTFGGALFAAFPEAYATVFSGFYDALMLLIFALIFRAVSIEFRSKRHTRWWRRAWDVGLALGSFQVALLAGIAVGNVIQGVPLASSGDYAGRLQDQLGTYPILVGVLSVTLFAMHGAIYLYLKTEGDLQERTQRWMWRSFGLFLVCFMLTTIYTLVEVPGAVANFQRHPVLWAVPVLNVLAIANIPRALFLERPSYAFASSCCTVAALVFLLGAALYPNLVISSPYADRSLTLWNAASSPKTLGIMLVIALIGMPLVISYSGMVYWTFRGKVELDEHSY